MCVHICARLCVQRPECILSISLYCFQTSSLVEPEAGYEILYKAKLTDQCTPEVYLSASSFNSGTHSHAWL